MGVSRLHAHRGAEAIGDDALKAEEEAIAHRHPAAVQGVGLHRVDDRSRSPGKPEPGRQAKDQSAQRQDQDLGQRQCVGRRKVLIEVLAVEPFLDEVRPFPGGDGQQTRDCAHRRGDDEEPELAGPDLDPQPMQRGPPQTQGPGRCMAVVGGDGLGHDNGTLACRSSHLTPRGSADCRDLGERTARQRHAGVRFRRMRSACLHVEHMPKKARLSAARRRAADASPDARICCGCPWVTVTAEDGSASAARDHS